MAKKGKSSKKRVNPWAVCNARLGKGRSEKKFERCVKKVKKSARKSRRKISRG
ncbi:MAG: hypothetical protein GF355_09620 [Candidatus Eisenbacteria bacterium]|nr:hypothetical protein [Candidatus Eisenbacteria bacterium]